MKEKMFLVCWIENFKVLKKQAKNTQNFTAKLPQISVTVTINVYLSDTLCMWRNKKKNSAQSINQPANTRRDPGVFAIK